MASKSPIAWFEIVVKNLPQATSFYESVFDCKLTPYTTQEADGSKMEMALFPYEEGFPGGGLVSSPCYDNHHKGPSTIIIYLDVPSIAQTLEKVEKNKGKLTFPCTPIGENGFIAGFEDLEGNAIGIWSMLA